jgi:hypothetical protein
MLCLALESKDIRWGCPVSLTACYAKKIYGGSEDIAPSFMTSAPDGCKWSVSRPSHFIPRERVLRIHWIGGCVTQWVSLNTVEEKNLVHVRNWSPAIQPTDHHYTNQVIITPQRTHIEKLVKQTCWKCCILFLAFFFAFLSKHSCNAILKALKIIHITFHVFLISKY